MTAYRLLISLFALANLLRSLRKDGLLIAQERLWPRPIAASQPRIWVHGASNGELASVLPVLQAIMRIRPDIHWVVTANTTTGIELARSWNLPNSHVRIAPIDLAWLSKRAMRLWRVAAYISLEAEIWPNRVFTCPGPTFVLGARFSERTARSWSKLPALATRVLGHLDYVAAQDAGSLVRLRTMGVADNAVGPVVDLKSFYKPKEKGPLDAQMRHLRSDVWLAASTHDGEEDVILRAHTAAKTAEPKLKLILALRHPGRATDIANLIASHDLTYVIRSSQKPFVDQDVLLVDTMGEMHLWYRAAGRVFIGGSLTDRGGHTPYEPAAYGAALIHGPDVRNFQAAYAKLAEHHAAFAIRNADELAKALRKLAGADPQHIAGRASQVALTPTTNSDSFAADIVKRLASVEF